MWSAHVDVREKNSWKKSVAAKSKKSSSAFLREFRRTKIHRNVKKKKKNLTPKKKKAKKSLHTKIQKKKVIYVSYVASTRFESWLTREARLLEIEASFSKWFCTLNGFFSTHIERRALPMSLPLQDRSLHGKYRYLSLQDWHTSCSERRIRNRASLLHD